ncbi:MAG: oligosaccharide flippase family protein [Pirellulales bacterium]
MEAQPVRVPISKRLILINSFSGIVTRILTVGVFAWAIQYLMKRIPEAELALLPVVLSLVLVVPLLQSIFTGGLSRFVTEAYARNDLIGVTRIVSSQFPFLLATGVVTVVLGSGLAWNVDHLLNIPPEYVGKARLMMFMIVGRIAVAIVLAPFSTGLFAQQRFVLQNMIDVGSSLLRIVLMLVFILGIGPRVEWVVASQVIAQLVGQFATAAVSMSLFPALRYRAACFDWGTSRRVLSFSGWSFVSQASNVIRRSMDAPILYLFANPVAVNDFFLGSTFESQLRELAIRATQPLLPAFTAMHAHGQQGRLSAVFLRGARIALWATMFLAVPLMVFSYDLFSLYLGDKYPQHINAATAMIILLLAFPFTYPTSMFLRIAYARGEVRQIAIRGVVGQICNLVLTLILVGTFQLGAIGSAVATLVAFAIVDPMLNWPLALQTLEIPWSRFVTQTLLPGLVPAIVAAGAGLLVIPLVNDSPLARMAIGMPACMLTYSIALALALKPADRADVARIRQKVMDTQRLEV